MSVRLTAALTPQIAFCLINRSTMCISILSQLQHSGRLTCSVKESPICLPPWQVWDGDSNGATAEQHVVPNSAPDACHRCVDTWELTAPQLDITEQDPGYILRCWTPQPRVNERHWKRRRLLELDQVVEPTVTHPGVVMETWRWGHMWGYRRKMSVHPADGRCGC